MSEMTIPMKKTNYGDGLTTTTMLTTSTTTITTKTVVTFVIEVTELITTLCPLLGVNGVVIVGKYVRNRDGVIAETSHYLPGGRWSLRYARRIGE